MTVEKGNCQKVSQKKLIRSGWWNIRIHPPKINMATEKWWGWKMTFTVVNALSLGDMCFFWGGYKYMLGCSLFTKLFAKYLGSLYYLSLILSEFLSERRNRFSWPCRSQPASRTQDLYFTVCKEKVFPQNCLKKLVNHFSCSSPRCDFTILILMFLSLGP